LAVDVPVEQATPGALPLSLDDAIDRGLKHNLQVLLATQTEQSVRGQILGVYFALLPNMRATAYTNALELNLAAMGFKPSSLAAFGFPPGTVHEITKVDTTSAQLSANQVLFNLTDFYLYAAARKAANVVAMNLLNARGGVVDAVGTQYLAALADEAQIANARALLTADEEVLRQATLAHDAGVGTNLDVLRARVQVQSEQQALVRAQNTFAKDKIALNRLIGQPAEQELTLTDAVPYAELAEMPLDQARALAYQRRKDLLGLTAQLEVAQRAQKAVKYERLPSLAFDGNYGVLGVTHGSYHGVFSAQGTLKIPLFEEGRFRGESEVPQPRRSPSGIRSSRCGSPSTPRFAPAGWTSNPLPSWCKLRAATWSWPRRSCRTRATALPPASPTIFRWSKRRPRWPPRRAVWWPPSSSSTRPSSR
jgi:outer membrane protein TolC